MTAEYPFDVIIVLGAALGVSVAPGEGARGVTPEGARGVMPGPANIRRAEHGVKLFGCGCAPQMLMSGGFGPRRLPDPPVTEARVLADLAVAAGVPEDRITLEEISRRTIENAAWAAAAARAHGWRRALIVTDAFHLPRAVLCFRAAGLDCAGSPVWRWRPGGFAAWAAGWPREVLALGFYAWLAVSGRARRIADTARAGVEKGTKNKKDIF